MPVQEDIEIKRAYTEVLEILYNIPQWQLNKIPFELIKNMELNKDTDYLFEYDTSKNIDEQEISELAQGIIIKIYREYLSEDETEFWNKYDKICYNIEEKNKREKYNVDVFKNIKEENSKKSYEQEQKNENNQLVTIEKENIFKKIFNKIKKFFTKK